MTLRDHSSARRRGGMVAVALAMALGCNPDKALRVDDIDVLTPVLLGTRAGLPALVAGTAAAFQIAYSGGGDLANGGHEGIVSMSGLFADEFLHAETFPDRQSIDQRKADPGNGSLKGVFFDLAQARAIADLSAARFEQLDNGAAGHADVLNYAGFAYVLFAETFCSGVPFSTLTEAGVEFGEPQTRDAMLQSALTRFDRALSIATTRNDVTQQRVARIGRARALVNLGRFTDAAQAVSTVPTGFAFEVEGSTNSARQNNGVWNYTINFFGFSVPEGEGGTGLHWSADLRTPAAETGETGFDGETPYVAQQKYPDKSTNVALATGRDARLTEAEAALREGNVGTMLSILNTLRSAESLPALSDPGTARARQALLFEERARWTWLTGQRMGALRRLVRQYGWSQAEAFPSGAYHKGGTYGTDVTFPVSADEKNNPRFTACIDRNP